MHAPPACHRPAAVPCLLKEWSEDQQGRCLVATCDIDLGAGAKSQGLQVMLYPLTSLSVIQACFAPLSIGVGQGHLTSNHWRAGKRFGEPYTQPM